MSWWAIWVMVGGSLSFKILGVMGFVRATNDGAPHRDSATATISVLLPAALFAALVSVQTLEADGALQLDARLWGVLAGTVAVISKAPFLVVVMVAMVVTAIGRGQTFL